MEKNDRIYVAGHTGMVGSALLRKLEDRGYQNIIKRTHEQLDLTIQSRVEDFFMETRPDYVFLAAAKVGGIYANLSYPVDFLLNNLLIQCNVLGSSFKHHVKKIISYGSACMYPRNCEQPIKEEYLLTGEFEQTNEAYAIAKLTGLKMCEYYNKQYGTKYINLIPANLYGENDNYDEKTSHVIPAIIRKMHNAKLQNKPTVEIWGTGKPVRDFLYVDDLADASLYIMANYNGHKYVNIGTGVGISIEKLVNIIKGTVQYKGSIIYDSSKPDGMYKKVLDVTKINNLGWRHKIDIYNGIQLAYKDYISRFSHII